MGVVMKPWIRSGEAPGYTVVMLTTVFDSLGYCRIGRLVAALKPISRINRLTTTDNTGRLMKISVQTIAVRSVISITRRSSRDRRSRIGRDGNGRSRLQLELPDCDHSVARFQPADDFGAAVDPTAGPHERAHGGETGLAVILFFLGDEKHRVAVERVVDGGFGHADHWRLLWKHHGGGREHPGL